jgi:hypothetical protein
MHSPRSGRRAGGGRAPSRRDLHAAGQRIRALNHFIDDVYHEREIVHERLVP